MRKQSLWPWILNVTLYEWKETIIKINEEIEYIPSFIMVTAYDKDELIEKAKDVKKNIENRRPNPRSVTGSSNIGGSLADMFDFKK